MTRLNRAGISPVLFARTLSLIPVFLVGCMGALELAPDDSQTVLSRQLLDAPSPL